MKRFALAVVIVLAILLAAVVVWKLSGIVILLLASLAIAAVARAPIEYLIQRDIPRRLAIIMVYVIGVGLAAGVAYIVVVRISRELATLSDELIASYTSPARPLARRAGLSGCDRRSTGYAVRRLAAEPILILSSRVLRVAPGRCWPSLRCR